MYWLFKSPEFQNSRRFEAEGFKLEGETAVCVLDHFEFFLIMGGFFPREALSLITVCL